MRLGIVTLLLVLAGCGQGAVSSGSAIPETLQGRWEATAEACNNTDMMLKVEQSSLILLGLRVSVAKATRSGDDAFLIEGKAQEEAEPFDMTFTLRRTAGGLELTQDSSPVPFSMVSCEPGASVDVAGVSTLRAAVPAVPFPQPTGPVANYLRSEVPVSFQGRWAAEPVVCSTAQGAFTIAANTITSAALSAELGDIEVNESAGVIIDITANGKFTASGDVSDARVNMRLSRDGSRLLVGAMGLAANGGLSGELGRCP